MSDFKVSGEASLIKNDFNFDFIKKDSSDSWQCSWFSGILRTINPKLFEKIDRAISDTMKAKVERINEAKKLELKGELDRREEVQRHEDRLALARLEQQANYNKKALEIFISYLESVKKANPWLSDEQTFTEMLTSLRLTTSESRNLINVLSGIDLCNLTATTKAPDPYFIDYAVRGASHAYDEVIRDMWTRVINSTLSNEAQYSKRALSILENMAKEEAETFKSICSTRTWKMGCGKGDPLIFNFDIALLKLINENLREESIRELASIGLISISNEPRIYAVSEAPNAFSRSGVDIIYEPNPDQYEYFAYNLKGGESARGLRQRKVIKFYFGDRTHKESPIDKTFSDNITRQIVSLGYVSLTAAGRQIANALKYETCNEIGGYINKSYETLRSMYQ